MDSQSIPAGAVSDETAAFDKAAAPDATTPDGRTPGAAPGPDPARDLTGTMLTTGRLVLTAPTAADVDAIFEICQDPAIQAWTMVPSPYRREHAEQFMGSGVPHGLAAGTDAVFGVYHAVSGRLLGMVGLHGITRPDAVHGAQAEIGYWTAPYARRQGYTAEAVRAVCRWGLAELKLDRIEWTAFEGNEASRALARRVGFTLEGTLRSRMVHRGKRIDVWIGSLLPGDPL
jgi:RimJ/RimL family protein N-acetyltransferase